MRVHEMIAEHSAETLALIDHDDTRVTYGALRDEAVDLADRFRAAGIRPGDRLILVSENAACFIRAILAASHCDAWFTLINARMSADELAAVVDHSGARAVVFTADVSEAARAHGVRLGAEPLAPGLWLSPVRDVDVEPVVDGPEQIAALLYTTGTTSAPKGVMLSHGNLWFNARNSSELNGLGPGVEVLAMLPGTHVYGLASMCLPALYAGATLRMVPRFDPDLTIRLLRGSAMVFQGVPQMFARIVAALDGPLDAPKLRRITTGGAPLDPELKARVEAAFRLVLSNGYGMTECSPTIAATQEGKPVTDISCGPPAPGVEVRVVDPDAEGIGALEIGGGGIMQGYYRDPNRTREALTEDRFLRSGDLGRIDADGNVHVVGRVKELIIRGGFNVYPPEVEGMLTKHPDVSVAAVVGRAVSGDEEIVAFVIPTGHVTAMGLKTWLRERLVAYKVPQRIVIADRLPSAATGKVLKHKLLAHFAAELEGADG